MLTLHQVSRRLEIPVDVLWRWVAEGKLQAKLRPGHGFGMEYYFNSDQLGRAQELKAEEPEHLATPRPNFRPVGEDTTMAQDAVASPTNGHETTLEDSSDQQAVVEVSEESSEVSQSETALVAEPEWLLDDERPHRTRALVAMEGLRHDTLTAVRRQVDHDTAMREMIGALDLVITTTLKALARAQDLSQARLASSLDALRSQLSDQVREREAQEAAMQKELSRTHGELSSMLKAMNPSAELPPLNPEDKTVIETVEATPEAQPAS